MEDSTLDDEVKRMPDTIELKSILLELYFAVLVCLVTLRTILEGVVHTVVSVTSSLYVTPPLSSNGGSHWLICSISSIPNSTTLWIKENVFFKVVKSLIMMIFWYSHNLCHKTKAALSWMILRRKQIKIFCMRHLCYRIKTVCYWVFINGKDVRKWAIKHAPSLFGLVSQMLCTWLGIIKSVVLMKRLPSTLYHLGEGVQCRPCEMPRWPPRPTIRQAFLAVLCLVVCLMVAGVLVYQGNSRPRFHRPTLLQAKVYAGENIVFPESQVLGSQNADSGSKTRDSGSQGSPDNAEQAMVLMSQYKPTHKGPTVDPSLLEGHISLLVKSMMSNKTMLHKLPTAPQCVGEGEGEVEDILCRPRPKFIPEVKNPCWYVKVKAKRGSNKKKRKLRCLPYFHILGVPKSATTDLWNRMMYHPHLVPNGGLLHKEALWWSWQRYGMVGYNQHRRVKTFKDYVDLFNTTAWQVKLSLQMNDEHHKNLITGDASPPDFWDFRGWRNISQNRGLSWPRVITPHLMAHFYAKPRFILMFRDPVERMYSDYFFVGGGLTTLDFHNDVKATIHMLASCVRILGMQRCFYDSSLYNKLPVRLPFACYSVYLREWLGVFPVDNFLFLHNEDYAADPVKTIKEVFAFLDLAPLEQSDYDKILDEERSRVTVEKSKAGEMMGETRDILHRLLDPCTAELKRMTQTT